MKTCGGFELLTTKEKSRTELGVVSFGTCSTDQIHCFGTGRIYTGPIQKDICLNDDTDIGGDKYEDCLSYNMPIALSDMQKHMDICGVRNLSHDPIMAADLFTWKLGAVYLAGNHDFT